MKAETNTYQRSPRSFIRQHGLLLERKDDAPLEKRPRKHELLEIEKQKGGPLRAVKFNNKFYLYRVV